MPYSIIWISLSLWKNNSPSFMAWSSNIRTGARFPRPLPLLSSLVASESCLRDIPGGPVARTSTSEAGGLDSISGWGAEHPHASWPKNPRNKNNIVTNSVKTLKMVHIKNKFFFVLNTILSRTYSSFIPFLAAHNWPAVELLEQHIGVFMRLHWSCCLPLPQPVLFKRLLCLWLKTACGYKHSCDRW